MNLDKIIKKNYDFFLSTWGESIIQLAQYVIIMNLMCVYRGRHRNAIGCMILYIVVMVTLLCPTPPLVPPQAIMILKILNLPIEAAFKVGYENVGKPHDTFFLSNT